MNETFTLEFPDPILSPNKHYHWRVKDPHRKAAILRGKEAANLSSARPTRDKLTAEITFHPPDNISRDMDNLHSSLKHYLDGLCRGIGIDDKQIRRVVLEWGEAAPPDGYVTVKLVSM